jgi:GPH family glycoside/pentoside/hexuronide:cation symporter
LLPFYVDYVLDPPDTQKTLGFFLLLYFGTSFFCVPLWIWAARRFGKLQAWLGSFGIGISAGIGLFFVGKGDVTWVALLHVWAGIAFGAGFLLVPAMQADVIDYDQLYTGQRREAQFTAFWAMVPKFVAIPGAALPIAVLAMIGYRPNVDQTPEVLLGIRVIYALVPAAFGAAAFFLARLYPVTESVHASIRAGIAAHERGEDAVDPLTGRIVPPPSARVVDPQTAWFLDFFAPGELRRVVARGAAGLRGVVLLKAGLCAALFLAAVGVCLATVGDLGVQPGLSPVFAVVTAGFALTGGIFHLMRLSAAARMERDPVPPDLVRAHLALTQAPAPGMADAASAMRRAS